MGSMGDDTPAQPANPGNSNTEMGEQGAEPEITDLRSPARLPLRWRHLWSAHTLAGGPLTMRQRFWRGGSALLAVLLALLVIFAGTRAASAPPPPPGATAAIVAHLNDAPPLPQIDGLTCVADEAWAPDSSRYAVLGYGGGCDVGHDDPGVLNLYSPPRTLITRVAPSEAILRAAGRLPPPATHATPGAAQSGSGSAPLLFYRSVLWSPDGQQLAITFTLVLSYQPYTGYDGVDLMTVAGGLQQVMLTPDLPTAGASYLEWDLAHAQPLTRTSIPLASPDFAVNIPVAPAYQWAADGRLVPSASGRRFVPVGPSPIGNPASDSFFTLWQPGQISLVNQSPNGTAYPNGAYEWSTSFPAWSPDGRYLLDDARVAGRLEPLGKPTPSAATLADLKMDTLPVLPVRDAGLRQALLSLTSSNNSAAQALSLAWRPDGRVLAATGGGNVTLYDCATGQSRSVDAPLPAGYGLGGVQDLLRWSPDGRWLLLSGLRILRLD